MADPTKPLKRDDVLRFLQAKSARPCGTCGSPAFDVYDEERVNGRVVLSAPEFPEFKLGGAEALEMIAMSCTNCSTVRFLHRRFVADWIGKNPA
jgi:hypothetical protein